MADRQAGEIRNYGGKHFVAFADAFTVEDFENSQQDNIPRPDGLIKGKPTSSSSGGTEFET